MLRKIVFSQFGAVIFVFAALLAGCGGGGGGSSSSGGTIVGSIINNSDGTPVTTATVSVGNLTTSTDASGAFTLKGVAAGSGIVVNVTSNGFALGSKIVSVTNHQSTRADVSLLPVVYSTSFDPTSAQTVTANAAGTAQVELAANALVTAANAAPSGNVTANVTPIDPTSNPQLMPGNFSASVATGSVATDGIIETYGAMEVDFKDSTGAALNLANGQSATIRIPVAAGAVSPPTTIPAYYYDSTTGKWIEEGTLTLASTGTDSYYTGTVNHFSVWNADMPLTTSCITGRVVDDAGAVVADAQVIAEGRDYIGTSEIYTSSDGTFTIPVKEYSEVIIYAVTVNALSQSVVITSAAATDSCTALPVNLQLGAAFGSAGSGSAKITLTWGADPYDLDSHLTGPAPEGSGSAPNDSDSTRFHVYYAQQGNLTSPPYANLDVDDTSSFGPEVTTISKFYPGVYRFSVHHFAGTGTIFSSPARVELTVNGVTQVFTPPDPGSTALDVNSVWQVFEINVSSSGAATVSTLNQYLTNISDVSVTSVKGSGAKPGDNPLIFSNLPAK